MATFSLIPYSFKIHEKGDKTQSVTLSHFNEDGDDFCNFVHEHLSNDDGSHIFNNKKKTMSIAEMYLFCWDKIQESDTGRLTKVLNQHFDIEWIKTAVIEKIDGRTIKISAEKRNLWLSLNDEENKVYLKIDDGRSYDFIAKRENGELNIYGKRLFKHGRSISGITKYGEFGIVAPFFNVKTRKDVDDMQREEEYSELYPFFFLLYIPEGSRRGTVILQTYKNIGIKTIFERLLNKLIEEMGLVIEFNHKISRDLLDQIDKSRLIKFDMIRHQVPMDVAGDFKQDNPKEIHEIHSIVANRDKEIKLSQRIRDIISENKTTYYEVLGEEYDQIKVLIDMQGFKKTLTFGNNDNKYRESMKLSANIPLEGGFPSYDLLLKEAMAYLEHIEMNHED